MGSYIIFTNTDIGSTVILVGKFLRGHTLYFFRFVLFLRVHFIFFPNFPASAYIFPGNPDNFQAGLVTSYMWGWKFSCNIPNFQVFIFSMLKFTKFLKLVILSLDFWPKAWKWLKTHKILLKQNSFVFSKIKLDFRNAILRWHYLIN